MKINLNFIIWNIVVLILILNPLSALVVNADYISVFPGENGKILFNLKNNEKFDLEDISIQIIPMKNIQEESILSLPFTFIGSSERSIENLYEGDKESVTFVIRPSTEIAPGDYNIPYRITYYNSNDKNNSIEKIGSFGIRVGAKTELDFVVETEGNAIIGQEGKISLEIINKGLGDVKSVSVEVIPTTGFELLSKNKIFIGKIDADDTEFVDFNVIYKERNPNLIARIEYKDFDNNEQIKIINIPIKVYTKEEALDLGLIQKNKIVIYSVIIGFLLIFWFILRKIRKKKKGR